MRRILKQGRALKRPHPDTRWRGDRPATGTARTARFWTTKNRHVLLEFGRRVVNPGVRNRTPYKMRQSERRGKRIRAGPMRGAVPFGGRAGGLFPPSPPCRFFLTGEFRFFRVGETRTGGRSLAQGRPLPHSLKGGHSRRRAAAPSGASCGQCSRDGVDGARPICPRWGRTRRTLRVGAILLLTRAPAPRRAGAAPWEISFVRLDAGRIGSRVNKPRENEGALPTRLTRQVFPLS